MAISHVILDAEKGMSRYITSKKTKMIKKLMNISGAQVLGKEELMNVKGMGPHVVTQEEYCNGLAELADGEYAQNEWSQEEWNNWGAAWSKHCM